MFLLRLVLLAVLFAPAASAQIPLYTDEGLEASLRLGSQFRFSALHDDETDAGRLGFGIRRARFQAFVNVGDRLRTFVQLEGGSEAVSLLDARGSYQVTPRLQVRGGRFIGAQPAAFALTPFFRLDAVDRPVTARLWAARTIGADGRDFGVEALYTTDAVEARLMLGNGDGSWSRLRGNLREDVGLGDPTRGVETKGVALSGALVWRPSGLPGLEAGGFASVNGSRNPNTAAVDGGPGRSYRSAAAHAYWGREPGSQPVRLKADVLLVAYGANGAAAPAQTFGGVVLFGAVRPTPGVEAFVQGERFVPDLDDDLGATLATVGATVSFSALRGGRFETARLTGGWTTRFSDDDAFGPGAEGLVVQIQLLL